MKPNQRKISLHATNILIRFALVNTCDEVSIQLFHFVGISLLQTTVIIVVIIKIILKYALQKRSFPGFLLLLSASLLHENIFRHLTEDRKYELEVSAWWGFLIAIIQEIKHAVKQHGYMCICQRDREKLIDSSFLRHLNADNPVQEASFST